MYQFNNEDVAWQRLQDIQREMENSRLLATSGLPIAMHLLKQLGERVWLIAGLAMRRAPRRHRAGRIQESEAARDAA
jgi:hypothetical protein